MLALHLLSAFAVAAALVLFSVLVSSGRRMTTLEQTRTLFRVAPVGPADHCGPVLVVVFGLILALDSDRFEIWDPWIILAIVPRSRSAASVSAAAPITRTSRSAPRRRMATRPRCSRFCAHPPARCCMS